MKTLILSILFAAAAFLVYGEKIPYGDTVKSGLLGVFKLESTTEKPDQPVRLQETEEVPIDRLDAERVAELARKDTVIVTNPLAEKIMKSAKSWKAQTPADTEEEPAWTTALKSFLYSLHELSGSAVKLSFGWALIVIPLMLGVRNNRLSGAGYCVANTGFRLSRALIFISSVIAVFAWFAFRHDFLSGMGMLFFAGLFALMASSALALKLYDYNNPVWNNLFISAVWPTASGLVVRLL